MKRTFAIILCVLSLVCSLGAVVAGIVALCVTDRLIDQSQIVAIETTLRTYADSLNSLRDSIDVTGSQIPVYALTLQKTAKLFRDAQKAADEMEKVIDMEITVPVLGNMQPFGSLQGVVRDLREFIPQFAKSLSAAEKSLSGYTPTEHEKIIDSIDKTVLLLQINADKVEEQIQVLRRCLNGFLCLCILASLAHGGLAVAILLILPGEGGGADADSARPGRRRISFA